MEYSCLLRVDLKQSFVSIAGMVGIALTIGGVVQILVKLAGVVELFR